MGFLSPWFLTGLAALGLPVWFHLLKKHKSTPLPFSSLMFFEKRQQSSVKHRRLQYLLLFALRMALLAMLTLAFAGPYIFETALPAGDGRRLTVLAIDDSYSMRQGGRLDRARQEALGVLRNLSAGGEAEIIAFAGQVRVLSQPSRDRASQRAAVQSIAPGDSRSSYGDLVRALRSVAQSSGLPLEVHLFTDLQKSSLPPSFPDLQLPEGARLILHPVAERTLPNWTVENVNAPARLHELHNVRIQATVAGFDTEAARRRVSLVLNGKVLETKTVDVPAAGRAAVEFLSLEAPYGLNRGEVRLDSGDSFPEDDHFYFSVERADPLPVLFVHEERDVRSALYFRTALESAAQSAFAFEDVPVQKAAGVSPGKYAFVVLSNLAAIPKGFEDSLREYVRKGGAVWIALGTSSSARGSVPLLGRPILESRYFARRGERFQTVDWVDAAHPSLRRANRWDGVGFYQVVRVDPGDARILARFADGTPVLLEAESGAGRVLVFASTFDNISNDFPLHASFVPFVEQTASYLAGLEERRGNFVVDSFLELRKSREQDTTVEVMDPAGNRALDLSETSTLRDLPLRSEGFYDVRRGNGQRELVAVNTDRRESDLALIPKDTLALWQNTGEERPTASGKRELQSSPRSLWWYAMLFALLLAIAESIVAGRYLAARKEAA